MASRLKTTTIALARLLGAICFLAYSSAASSIEMTPSPSLDGSFSVDWNLGTWCQGGPHYSYCYTLWESSDGGASWHHIPTSQGQTHWDTSGRPPGTYGYYIYYEYSDPAWNEAYIAEGPTYVNVIVPPEISIDNTAVYEGDTATFTVTRTGDTSVASTVYWYATDGTAVSGSDYVYASGSVDFAVGETSKPIYIGTVEESTYEDHEYMYVVMYSPVNATLSAAYYGYTYIYNDDAAPYFTINDPPAVSEGGVITFTVTKNGASAFNHDVGYATGTGSAGSGDFTAASGTISFASWESSKPVYVTTLDDALFENSETMVVNLSPPPEASSGDNQGVGTITSGDAAPTFSVTPVAPVSEGTPLQFTITLNGQSQYAHNVNFATSNGSAQAPADYTSTSGTRTGFTSNTSQLVSVTTINDSVFESDETVNLNLSGATGGATIGGSQAVGTINDNTAPFLSLAPNTTGQMPGITAGSFGIDVLGNATYALPIIVPPGTAGMEPEVSLQYSSANGNGLVGIGWTISGLSTITRCPMTLGQDGAVDGIDYDADDRFCLDGQRLIGVGAGAYGGSGKEYRTELDQFAKIISHGLAGSGPAYFTVRTKSGRIIEYGNTADSRIEIAPAQATVRVWAANKVSDTVGNYMTISYSDQSNQTDFQPELIQYTMNSAGGVTAPFASVDFVYQTRPDVVASGLYQGGWPVTGATNRLSNIRTFNGAALVRDYQLSYNNGGIGGASRVQSVTECSGSGECLPPTAFAWVGTGAPPTLAATQLPWQSDGYLNADTLLFGDWNGDGRMDLFRQRYLNSTSTMYTADAGGNQVATGFTTPGWSQAEGQDLNKLLTGDFNGDGRTDIARVLMDYIRSDDVFGVITPVYTAYLSVYHSTGTAFTQAGSTLQMDSEIYATYEDFQAYARASDFNGDGRTDLLVTPSRVAYANASGQITSVPFAYTVGGTHRVTADFDGDGRSDLLTHNGTSWAINLWNGTDFTPAGQIALSDAYVPVTADFNGDGLDDVFLKNSSSSGTGYFYLSKGDGQVIQATAQASSTTGLHTFYVGDWNNDGRADIAHHNSGGSLLFDVSTGNPGDLFSFLTSKSWPNSSNSVLFSGDFNGDGITDLWDRQYSSDAAYLSANGGPDLLSQITDGFGAVTQVAYLPMTSDTVYTKGALLSHPRVTVQTARRLVRAVTVPDGAGGQRTENYHYQRAAVDVNRRVGLGFEKVTATDERTNLQTTSTFRQEFPWVGMLLRNESKHVPSGLVFEETDYNLGGGAPTAGVYSPVVADETTQRYELSGTRVAKTMTLREYDAFGNATKVTLRHYDPASPTTILHRVETARDFSNDTTNWLIGQLVCERTKDPTMGPTRTIGYEYAPTTGLLLKEAVEPIGSSILEPAGIGPCVTTSVDPDVTLVTTYSRGDAFGNVTGISAVDGTTTRTTNFLFGELGTGTALTASNGRFPVRVTRVIASGNHEEYSEYDARFGLVKRFRDANGFNVHRTFDGFGRVRTETRPDGSMTDIGRAWCTAPTCPAGGKFKTVASTTGAPPAAIIVDSLGREIATAELGFAALTAVVATEYNNKGEVWRRTRPHFVGQTQYWTTFAYDALSRLTSETAAGESGNVITTTEYFAGGTTGGSPSVPYAAEIRITNAKNQQRRELYNARGELIEARDAAGSADQSTTRYTYDVFGNVLTTRVNGVSATTITNTYDIRGRKRTMDDPDLSPGAPVWSYLYTAFGEEVREQTDAKGQITRFSRDTLGRITQRVDAFGAANAVTSDFVFDSAANAKGSLASTSSSEGETKTYAYDSLGRLQTITTAISGQGSYVTRRDYDSLGRINKITYPASTAFASGLRVRYDFNPNGYLSEIRNDNSGATFNALYWQLNEQTADGQVARATFGNNVTTEHLYVPQTGAIDVIRSRVGTSGPGAIQNVEYDFDVLGNQIRREDVNQLVRERLSSTDSYDALNRVRTVRRYTGAASSETLAATRTIAYDTSGLGNVASKSHLTGTTTGSYDYSTAATCTGVSGQVAPGPHAVRRITAGSARDFCYDGNGNQLRGWNFTAGRVRDVSWTPYNMPKTVTENGLSLTFSYGADRARFKQVNAFTGETRLYVDGIYEKETVGTSVTHVHYIVAGGQALAIYKSRSDNVQQTRYLHRDHLGSITQITGEAGTLIENLSYDAWGKRRNANWSDPASQLYASQSRRGFTGHEHLDDAALIHMNGRIYDPNTAQMLSADPYVQFPGLSQSFNRYSYVLNNPLAFTDPSGYCVAGAACPTSGLASFSRGLGGAIGRTTFGGLGFFSIAHTRVTFHAIGLGSPLSVGGGGCNLSDSSGCAPGTMTFTGEGRNPFTLSMSTVIGFTTSSTSVYTYVYPTVQTPDGSGGASVSHHHAMFEQRFGGRSHSPLLDDQLTGFERFMMNLDLPDLNNAFVNFSGGFGDAALMGAGGWAREFFGIGSVDTSSGAYRNGGRTGTVAMIATGGAGLLRQAGAKIVGTAQTTGTWGHAAVSKVLAYAHALDPRVSRVTLDVGYRKLFEGTRAMVGRWGPRPDVGVLYRNGTAKVIEVASRTDDIARLQARHVAKWAQEGMGQPNVAVNNMAVRIDNAIRTVRNWFP
jgi:RHS repeat-associated protein